jgi:hypothetical protein
MGPNTEQPPQPARDAERPVPFTLRVAAHWTAIADAPNGQEGQWIFSKRAPLTGRLATTVDGRDVGFSDLEL